MAWWIWVVGGLALLGSELFIPLDFYLVFIGISGVLTGMVVGTGIIPEAHHQWILCALFSLALLFSLRKRMLAKIHGDGATRAPELEGEKIQVIEEISSGETGKGETRGSTWSIRNESASTLKPGVTYTVSRRDGLTLVVTTD
jgi:membrane protein implicated in regulation of membrane protease activity